MVRIGDNLGIGTPIPSSDGPKGTSSFDPLQGKRASILSHDYDRYPIPKEMKDMKKEFSRLLDIMDKQVNTYSERDWIVMAQQLPNYLETFILSFDSVCNPPKYEGYEDVKAGIDKMQTIKDLLIKTIGETSQDRGQIVALLTSVLAGELAVVK